MGFMLVGLTSGNMDNTLIAKASKNTKTRANTDLVTKKKIYYFIVQRGKKLLFYSSVSFSASLVTEGCFKDLMKGVNWFRD